MTDAQAVAREYLQADKHYDGSRNAYYRVNKARAALKRLHFEETGETLWNRDCERYAKGVLDGHQE
jgi:hypothetical protein